MKEVNSNPKEVRRGPTRSNAASTGNQNRRFKPRSRSFNRNPGLLTDTADLVAVSNTTAQGRNRRIKITVVAGDGKGCFGIGRAKSQNLTDASRTAQRRAIKNQSSYNLCKRRGLNLTHRTRSNRNGTIVEIRPTYSGGLKCPVIIQKILKVLGIKNASGSIIGNGSAAHNVIAATKDCLDQQETDIDYAKKLGVPLSEIIKRRRTNSYSAIHNRKAIQEGK